MERSKVKLRSRHNVPQLQPLANALTKYQLHAHYGIQDIPNKFQFYVFCISTETKNAYSKYNTNK